MPRLIGLPQPPAGPSHLRLTLTLGWAGLLALIAGAFVPLLLVGAPLAGLAVWAPGSPGDGPGPPAPDDAPPPRADVDWDAFMRELQRWSERPRSGTDLR